MIKLIIFDFDNTLCLLAEAHYISLNQAISELVGNSFLISREEQNSFYNGLSTKTKLNKLVKDKNLPNSFVNSIAKRKQELTIKAINSTVSENISLKNDLQKLKNEGYLFYCASNALLETVKLGLQKLNIIHLFDFIIGNDDLKRQKPAPDIYLKCFLHAGLDPKECLIVEDSKHGRESALRSGAFLCTVDNPSDVTYSYLKKNLSQLYFLPFKDTKLNVLIPAAGLGSRFKSAGFKLPKPLIDVLGKPMIQRVIENLNIEANYIFIVQKEHYEQYNLNTLLSLMVPGCTVLQTDGLTQGAACTALLAENLINNNEHLLIANSDQWVDWDSSEFMHFMLSNEVDGGILSFKDYSKNPKWSFAKVENELVTQVAEKNPISDTATVGIYYFSKGSEFVHYANHMINNDIKVNNEFYICPIYNEYIKDSKKIKTFDCNKMLGLGTPEDREIFLNSHAHLST